MYLQFLIEMSQISALISTLNRKHLFSLFVRVARMDPQNHGYLIKQGERGRGSKQLLASRDYILCSIIMVWYSVVIGGWCNESQRVV